MRDVPFDDARAARLVGELDAELTARYNNADEVFPAHLPQHDAPPLGSFLVAELDGQAVGCAGLRLLAPGVGEVKRMYVAPAARGQGLARALLRALVAHARAAGLTRLQLETGIQQPEAMALYAGEGWQPIEPYGHYRDSPLSRCFALELSS